MKNKNPKMFKYKPTFTVQAKNKEEAKIYIESRLQSFAHHPDGIDLNDIVEDSHG